MPVRQGSPQLWTEIPVHNYIKPVSLGRPQLWTVIPVHKYIKPVIHTVWTLHGKKTSVHRTENEG